MLLTFFTPAYLFSVLKKYPTLLLIPCYALFKCSRILTPHPTYDFQSTFMGVQSNPNISLGQILSKNHSKTGF
jgi:hypothetical protein